MDSEKFDDLIKRIGTARVSRLTALKGLLGGAAVALTGAAVATSDADAKNKKKGKSKKKGKKRQRNSQAVAPVYNDPPKEAPKSTTHAPTTSAPATTEAPKCPKDSYEDCGYDAKWSDESCSCECNEKYYDFCRAKDDPYYLYGTCVDTKCDEYYEYNPETCKCEEVCYPQTCEEYGYKCGKHDDGCGGYIECGDCSGKDYYKNSYCDEYGKCACDAYTCDYYECNDYDSYDDGCGGYIECPCKY
jgi:hypothetical protein